MNLLVVLFHSANDDIAPHQLNQALNGARVLADKENPIRAKECLGGKLVVCFDQSPGDAVKAALAENLKESAWTAKMMLLHARQADNAQAYNDQQKLVAKDGVLDGAKTFDYHHEVNHPLYAALVDGLTAQVQSLEPLAIRCNTDPNLRMFAVLQHRLSGLLLPLDIELQGWADSGFARWVGDVIARAYGNGGAATRLAEARQVLYGSAGGSKETCLETVVNSLEEFLPSTPEGDRGKKVQEYWSHVKAALPKEARDLEEKDSHPLNSFLVVFASAAADVDREELRGLVENNNFRSWWRGLSEDLRELRKVLSA